MAVLRRAITIKHMITQHIFLASRPALRCYLLCRRLTGGWRSSRDDVDVVAAGCRLFLPKSARARLRHCRRPQGRKYSSSDGSWPISIIRTKHTPLEDCRSSVAPRDDGKGAHLRRATCFVQLNKQELSALSYWLIRLSDPTVVEVIGLHAIGHVMMLFRSGDAEQMQSDQDPAPSTLSMRCEPLLGCYNTIMRAALNMMRNSRGAYTSFMRRSRSLDRDGRIQGLQFSSHGFNLFGGMARV